jgi:hypothetical protein
VLYVQVQKPIWSLCCIAACKRPDSGNAPTNPEWSFWLQRRVLHSCFLRLLIKLRLYRLPSVSPGGTDVLDGLQQARTTNNPPFVLPRLHKRDFPLLALFSSHPHSSRCLYFPRLTLPSNMAIGETTWPGKVRSACYGSSAYFQSDTLLRRLRGHQGCYPEGASIGELWS